MKILLIILGIVATLTIMSLIYLALSVGRFTNYWKDRVSQPAPKNALVYVALGDSAAQSVGALTPSGGYVGKFAKQLQTNSGRPVKIINISESGARIQDVIKDQLPLLTTYKADVITLDIGGNDIDGFDAQKFEQDYTELVSKLPKGTIVADVPFFGGRTQLPLFGSGQAEKDVQVANQIITNAVKDKPLHLVPLHQVTQQRIGRKVWYYAPDYFHPNNLGYNVWTETFWQTYRESEHSNGN